MKPNFIDRSSFKFHAAPLNFLVPFGTQESAPKLPSLDDLFDKDKSILLGPKEIKNKIFEFFMKAPRILPTQLFGFFLRTEEERSRIPFHVEQAGGIPKGDIMALAEIWGHKFLPDSKMFIDEGIEKIIFPSSTRQLKFEDAIVKLEPYIDDLIVRIERNAYVPDKYERYKDGKVSYTEFVAFRGAPKA